MAAVAAALLLLQMGSGGVAAEESRAYRGFWGNLLNQQQQQASAAAPRSSVHDAIASLQASLLERLNSSTYHLPSGLEDLFTAQLNFTLSLLGDHAAQNVTSNTAGTAASSPLQERMLQLHGLVAGGAAALEPQQLAALALIQGWTLGAVLGSSSSSSAGGNGGNGQASRMQLALRSSAGGGGVAEVVPDPAWKAFRAHTCMRLQNFGNADGYSAALLGESPCTTNPPTGGAVAAGNAAVSSAALRWGSEAAFLLDCSRGSGGGSDGGDTLSRETDGSGALSSKLLQAASKAAAGASASVAAALDRTSVCRLAVSGGSGGGGGGGSAVLEHVFERPLLGAPKLDALRIRICNIAPTTLQFPAALARGTTVRLAGLKLNGRTLLPAAVQATQAAAADGCTLNLFRVSARAARAGFVLTGWVQLAAGSSSSSPGSGGAAMGPSGGNGGAGGGGGGGGPGSGFGGGQLSSLELSLGEYSQLAAAASRLLGA
ncbi:hypothetical protein D9Q98_006938 [Chlorella vulgaris]|uniref:Uncharacterized protein n=1 Tax=Chlorella vulgaris TaxID=3077 RepID=A0A9D4YUG7_CHLVU|nr:hypothetical protein D9Q98_006938 [Chlorella vulgaris]